MQVSVAAGLMQRLVYYACSLYVDQMGSADDYVNLKPAISICLLSTVLFGDSSAPHHRFRLCDPGQGRELRDSLEVHTVELTKYNLEEATISAASMIEQWAYFLLNADQHEPGRLRELLPGTAFDQAISVVETISQKTEDRTMYDQREKALRDHAWRLRGAREEGREEGCDVGILAGKIQLIQQLLGEPESLQDVLIAQSVSNLTTLLDGLQQRLRDRSV